MITKKQFRAYEAVRKGAVTNMFDMRNVEELSGLARKEILEIGRTYEQLCRQWPDVRDLEAKP